MKQINDVNKKSDDSSEIGLYEMLAQVQATSVEKTISVELQGPSLLKNTATSNN